MTLRVRVSPQAQITCEEVEMRDKNNEVKQYSFETVLGLTLPSGQDLIKKTEGMITDNWQRECEEARLLSQDPDRLEIWQKLVAGGATLSKERARRLSLAEKIIRKSLVEKQDGWVELVEKPEEGEQ